MTYCMSDIHGRIDLFEKMLDKINLTEGDTLYILGDVIDRGGGLEVLKRVKELSDKGFAKLICGNHEAVFLNNLSSGYKKKNVALGQVDRMKDLRKQSNQLSRMNNYIKSKNKNSLLDLFLVGKGIFDSVSIISEMKEVNQVLTKSLSAIPIFTAMDSYETFTDLNDISDIEFISLINFLGESLRHNQVSISVNGKNYILVHAAYVGDVPDSYHLSITEREKFYMTKAKCDNATVIFGHTTTRDIKIRKYRTMEIPYTIWYDDEFNDKIGIDCGASYPYGQLACLRLDDMKEFYVKNERKSIISLDYVNDRFKKLQNVYRETLEEIKDYKSVELVDNWEDQVTELRGFYNED